MQQIKVELQEWMGSDLSIANAAWTSTYDKDKRESKYDDPEKVNSIVERLIRDGHGTPVEAVVFRFWIRMPIFVDRQHMTHRIATNNGLSGRYRTMPSDYYQLPSDVKEILFRADCSSSASLYERICQDANRYYKSSINGLKQAETLKEITNDEYKRAREVLRGMLPTSGMTERTTVINLRSFANYQKLRNSSYAQPEIKRVAELMLEQVEKANICPIAIKTLKELNWRI